MAQSIVFPYRPLEYTFSNVAQVTIIHNLGYKPRVTIVLEDGSVAYGDVTHTDNSQLVISFLNANTGTVIVG
jgi:hypothetical protein